MNTNDALKVLSVLKAAYPYSYKDLTREEAAGIARLWARQFASKPVDIVLMAIEKLIATHKFVPTIADVNEQMNGMYAEAIGMLKINGLSVDDRRKYLRIASFTRKDTVSGLPMQQQIESGERVEIQRIETGNMSMVQT